jgi:hypothetical protein
VWPSKYQRRFDPHAATLGPLPTLFYFSQGHGRKKKKENSWLNPFCNVCEKKTISEGGSKVVVTYHEGCADR